MYHTKMRMLPIGISCVLFLHYTNAFQYPQGPIHTFTHVTSRERRNSVTTCCEMEPSVTATICTAAVVTVASAAIYLSGSEEREKKKKYSEWEQNDRLMREERARLAYVEPKEYWNEEELKQFDGKSDEDGPILMGVNGEVYNVWKGRHFYGPGCEYEIFAGRDATRLLAKTKLEEETEEEKTKSLSIGERAALQGWIYTFKSKYEIVGKLDKFDPSSTTTRMN